jgi:hypothetical protein
LPFDGILDGKEKKTGLLSMKGFNNTPWPSFPSVKKNTQDFITYKVERLCVLGVLKQQQAST